MANRVPFSGDPVELRKSFISKDMGEQIAMARAPSPACHVDTRQRRAAQGAAASGVRHWPDGVYGMLPNGNALWRRGIIPREGT